MTDSPPLTIVPTPEPLATLFFQQGIRATTYVHPPVFTVAEGAEFKQAMPGGHTKNLFLKDKNESLWLLTALWDTQIDLKTLPARIGAGRLSFGSAALLEKKLGVIPGSVTPLALVNDAGREVRPVLDARLMTGAIVNCHPLRNDMTTGLSPAALLGFLQQLGYDPLIIDFAAEKPISGQE